MTDSNDHDRLCDLLDGRLDAAEAASLRARLEREPDLRAAWDDLVRLRDALRALPTPQVPADFARTVRARADASPECAPEGAPESDGVAAPPGLPRLSHESHEPDGEVPTPSAAPRGLLLRFPFALVAATLVVGIGVGAVLLASRPDAPPALDSARRPAGAAAPDASAVRGDREPEAALESATRTAGRAGDAFEAEGARIADRAERETASGVAAPVVGETPEIVPVPDVVFVEKATVDGVEHDDEAKAPPPVPPALADAPFGGLDKSAGKDAAAPMEVTYVLEADSVESGRAAVAAFLAAATTDATGAEIDRRAGLPVGRSAPALRIYLLRTPAAEGYGLGGVGGGGGGRAAEPENAKRREPDAGGTPAAPPPSEPAPARTSRDDDTLGATLGEIPLVLTDAQAHRLAVAAQPLAPEWRARAPADAKGDGLVDFEEDRPSAAPAGGSPRAPEDEKSRQPVPPTPGDERPAPVPVAPPSAVAPPKAKALEAPAAPPPPAPPAPAPRLGAPPAPGASAPGPTTPTPNVPPPAPKPAEAPAALPAGGAKKAEVLPPPTVRVRILVVPPRLVPPRR